MKILVIVLIAAILLSQFGISAATSSENSAARDLAASKSLAFGGVGVAGLMSEGERNLRAVLGRPDASQQLHAALAHATPAGELYILVGLRRCDQRHQGLLVATAGGFDQPGIAAAGSGERIHGDGNLRPTMAHIGQNPKNPVITVTAPAAAIR